MISARLHMLMARQSGHRMHSFWDMIYCVLYYLEWILETFPQSIFLMLILLYTLSSAINICHYQTHKYIYSNITYLWNIPPITIYITYIHNYHIEPCCSSNSITVTVHKWSKIAGNSTVCYLTWGFFHLITSDTESTSVSWRHFLYNYQIQFTVKFTGVARKSQTNYWYV